MEGVLGEEVWRRKFEQREGKRHLSKDVGGGWTLETKGKREREEAVWKGNWVGWKWERRKRATMDNGAKEKSASARSMRGTDELMEVKES